MIEPLHSDDRTRFMRNGMQAIVRVRKAAPWQLTEAQRAELAKLKAACLDESYSARALAATVFPEWRDAPTYRCASGTVG